MRALVVGCGYVGSVLAQHWKGQGHVVFGARRDPEPIPGVTMLAMDVAQPSTLAGVPDGLDWVVMAVGAKRRTEEAYRTSYVDGLSNVLSAVRPRMNAGGRIAFVSSTGVYGQSNGQVVDETSPTTPASFSGQLLLEAEALLTNVPNSTVIRLGGIYGPGRTSLVERVRAGEAKIAPGGPRYTNRIHRDDAALAIAHVLSSKEVAPVYLGVDDEPADERVVLSWLAQRLGAPVPKESESTSPAGSKRCSNARLRATGFSLRYPTFREGYESLLADSWLTLSL